MFPPFCADSVAIAAKNRNAASRERGILAIASDAAAIRRRFASTAHAANIVAAHTSKAFVRMHVMSHAFEADAFDVYGHVVEAGARCRGVVLQHLPDASGVGG